MTGAASVISKAKRVCDSFSSIYSYYKGIWVLFHLKRTKRVFLWRFLLGRGWKGA